MMILVTGGASSGKSAFAETLACALPGPHFYLAAMKPFGEEGARRIARHRALRAGKGFTTVECYNGLEALTAADCVVDQAALGKSEIGKTRSNAADSGESDARCSTALLESLGNVVANELFADDGSCASFEGALQAVSDGVEHVESLFGNVVIVGDEVGADGLRYDGETETYIRVIGSAACAIAARCDVVVECIAGQPLVVKGSIEGLANGPSGGRAPL